MAFIGVRISCDILAKNADFNLSLSSAFTLADYEPSLKSRFISSYLAVSFMALTFEFVRQRTYSELINSNEKKTFYLNKVMDQQKEIITQSEKLKVTNSELEQHRNHLEQLV
ncbi:hypothetical protein ACFLSE_08015, partial [Bacteroidota bacterium]